VRTYKNMSLKQPSTKKVVLAGIISEQPMYCTYCTF